MALEWLTKWFRSEDRAVGAGDSNLNTQLSAWDSYYSSDSPAEITQTAAVEFALGMVARSFMLAAPRPSLSALDPLTLAMLARQTIVSGNAVFEIDVNLATGDLRLLPVSSYEVAGGVRPETWIYAIEQEQASGGERPRVVPSRGMVHMRYLPPPGAPWHGVSPLVRAGVTAKQLARIERSLSYDAEAPVGYVMPMPDGAPGRVATQAKTALTTGKGGVSLIETTAGGLGAGAVNAPRRDWEQKRFGGEAPATNLALRDGSALAIMSAMGIPPSLYTSAGGAQRESFRHFHANTILPLAAMMRKELVEKLEQDFEFTFPEVSVSDISARSRAFAQFINAQIPMEEALKLAGLPPVDVTGVIPARV